MYEFEDSKEEGGASSGQTMWLTDARATRICPHAAPNFRCLRIETTRGETIAAFFVKTEKAKFTLLFSHGNATDIGYMRDHLLDLADTLKVNVLAYDYCGYGLSTGQPSVANVTADVEAAYDYLTNVLHIPANTIIPCVPARIVCLPRAYSIAQKMFTAQLRPIARRRCRVAPLEREGGARHHHTLDLHVGFACD